MIYQHYLLGHLEAGEKVEIQLSGSAANVRLLDDENYVLYQKGRNYNYYGGLATSSPVLIDIPKNANWHIAIDMNGFAGAVKTSVNKLLI